MFGKNHSENGELFRVDQWTAEWHPLPDEEELPAEPGDGAERGAVWHFVYEAAAVLCTAVLVTFLFFMLFRPVTVQGSSMFPTLNSGDHLLLYCFNYTPQRGDVVVVKRDSQEPLIKRVIAVAGDTLFIDPVGEQVYLNGSETPLYEPYINGSTSPLDLEGVVTVPEGHIVVLGDNRPHSHDSRSADIGMVSVEAVVGKAWVRLYPTFTVLDSTEE